MTTDISRHTLIAIRCEGCGHTTQEPVRRLIPANDIPCHVCGGMIQLEGGENAVRIQEIAEQLPGLGAALRKKRK